MVTGRPAVILSACQTGRSLAGEGDEATGLLQSFFSAGAGSVLSSLWSVEDTATSALLTNFCTNCTTMSPAAALREAILTLRKDARWHKPIYWASFQYTGIFNIHQQSNLTSWNNQMQ